MTELGGFDLSASSDPELAVLLCALDPFGFGGIVARGRAGPLRDRWLDQLRGLLSADMPVRRLPVHAGDGRIFGGLDLAATLSAGRLVAERGVLAETNGGLLLLSMAERLSAAMAARLGCVLDAGAVVIEREGIADRFDARFGCIALDEGIEPDERPPAALCDRLAFWVDLDGFAPTWAVSEAPTITDELRLHYRSVEADETVRHALAESALALGVFSMRASVLALRAAQASAALSGRAVVAREDAVMAARLVLAPRATRLPAAPDQSDDQAAPPEPHDEAAQPTPPEDDPRTTQVDERLADTIVEAARAAIPPDLLLLLQSQAAAPGRQQPLGRAGVPQSSSTRGRPTGTRRGSLGGGARLDVLGTLRAAAPWQRVRVGAAAALDGDRPARLAIRRDDLRIKRFKHRVGTTTIFVVDASGSLAANRLAEAKGAVELLLSQCYVRRDHVALLAFRDGGAQLLLPPTRSLARAKRGLAELPGGGSTPLACAIDTAVTLADQIQRRGQTPVVVFLTDGRGNVARDGTPGRQRAEDDARLAAEAAALAGHRMLVVDAAPRPQHAAQALAKTMNARYLPLPRADATALSRAVGTVASPERARTPAAAPPAGTSPDDLRQQRAWRLG